MGVTTALARRNVNRPTILDESGKPYPATRRMILSDHRGMETANTHPAFGLTADMLLTYMRQAERGQPLRQFDCFDDIIQVDGALRGMINDRIESVAGCDFVVMPPPGHSDKPSLMAAEALNECLQNQLKFRAFMAHQLGAVHYGFACSNLMWELIDGLVTPVEFACIAHRRFAAPRTERANEIWLINGRGPVYDLIDLEPGLWAVSRYYNIIGRNPYVAGLMNTCAWWSMPKRWSVRNWLTFAEMFGIPLAVGYYEEGASPASRGALEDAVKLIGSDGWAVLSSLTELVIKETARGGDSSTVYPNIIKICEEQIAKLITGGTLNTDVAGVGSYNAASVHESRSYAMKCNDAACLQEAFTRDIGTWFVRYNGFDRAAPPRLKIRIRRDSKEWAETLQIIGGAVEIDGDQIYEDFGLRYPAPGRGVKFEAAKPAGPGKEEKS